jgi:DNA-binding transcriptional LysR family regulator
MTLRSGVEDAFRGLTFERIESFLAVAAAGGIANAAPGNASRQSQLSRQLREVSEALGFEVVERVGRNIELTDDGRRACALFRDFASALGAMKQERTEAPLRLSLAAGDSVLRWVVLPTLHEALSKQHRVDLSLSAVTNGYRAVRDATFDMAICRTRKARDEGMKTTRVGSLRYAVFAPSAWKRRKDSQRFLESWPFVYVTGAPDLMGSFEELVGSPRIALRCETFPQAALAVRSGHYAALLPTPAARELAEGSVYALELDGLARLSLPLSLVARERRISASPTFAAFYRAMASQLERALKA